MDQLTPPPLLQPQRVQPLSYAREDDSPWLRLMKVAAVAALVAGVTHAASVGFQFAMTLSSGGLPALARGSALLAMIVYLGEGLAALVMVIAAVGNLRLRPWSHRLMLVAAIGLILMAAARGAATVWSISVSLGPTSWPPLFRMSYIGQSLAGILESIILPALILYLLTRQPVRRLFDSPSA